MTTNSEREYFLYLATGWRWCVFLPTTAIVFFCLGLAVGTAL